MRLRFLVALGTAFSCSLAYGQAPTETQSGTYMGRAVKLYAPKLDQYDSAPGEPNASICVDGPPQRQCYDAPKGFYRYPSVSKVQISKDVLAMFFSASTYGVSGFAIHHALLVRSKMGDALDNLFASETDTSPQSEDGFWNVPVVSDFKIFVTADYVWGPDECHTCPHRYLISAYVMTKTTELTEGSAYYLDDRYMTLRTYNVGMKASILQSEKAEIIARLGKIKAARQKK